MDDLFDILMNPLDHPLESAGLFAMMEEEEERDDWAEEDSDWDEEDDDWEKEDDDWDEEDDDQDEDDYWDEV